MEPVSQTQGTGNAKPRRWDGLEEQEVCGAEFTGER